jgi:hypothetical protein
VCRNRIKGKPEDIPTPADSLPAIEAIATHALRKEYSDAIEKGLASLKLLVEGSGREGSLPSEIIKDGKMICRWAIHAEIMPKTRSLCPLNFLLSGSCSSLSRFLQGFDPQVAGQYIDYGLFGRPETSDHGV